MVQGAVAYCPCGHELWVEYIRDGDAWTCRYSDNDHPELSQCPACGRGIQEEDLE